MNDDIWDDEEFRRNFFCRLKKKECDIGGNIILHGIPSKESIVRYNNVRQFFNMPPSLNEYSETETLFDLIQKDVPDKYLDEFERHFNSDGDMKGE